MRAADRPSTQAAAQRAPARRASLLVLAGSLLVAGCGQRGPLYLPENEPPRRRTQAAPQTDPEEPSR